MQGWVWEATQQKHVYQPPEKCHDFKHIQQHGYMAFHIPEHIAETAADQDIMVWPWAMARLIRISETV